MIGSPRRVFRFAPSPNGFLHLGHACSALLNFDLAQRCGGRFLLRIEDIDRSRARPEYEAAIYQDLAWLGLSWEAPVRRQSEHFGDYALALEQLDALGLLYACACTRGEISRAVSDRKDWPRDPDGAPLYPGTCRDRPRRPVREILREGGAALRLDSAKAAMAAEWGDAVLARKDVPASYHIAVVVDDALQGVTDVVRGKDLAPATSLHRLLQQLLGLPEPAWRHHDLVLDEAGGKLSKSRSSKSLRQLRAEGMTAEEVRRMVGRSGAIPSPALAGEG